MMSAGTLQATSQPMRFGRILLARAAWVLALFTVLFLVTFPQIPSEPPSPKPNLVPALVVLALGAAAWIAMLITWIRAFRSAAARPSLLSSVAFFLFFGGELLFAAFALQHL